VKPSSWLFWAVVAELSAAAIYELVLAINDTVGPVSGEGPAGAAIVDIVSLVALFFASLLSFAPAHRATFLLAPAGAAFVAARFYTADPYYAPTVQIGRASCRERV